MILTYGYVGREVRMTITYGHVARDVKMTNTHGHIGREIMKLVSGCRDRRLNFRHSQYVVSLRKTLYQHCFSRHS